MIRYVKIFKKNFVNKGEKSKEIKFLNKNFISKKSRGNYFINFNKTIYNVVKSSKMLVKYCFNSKNILIIIDSKFVKNKLKKFINFKNVKFSENIKCGNFTNFDILLRENKKHIILKKMLFKKKKRNINLYKKVKNNIKNKPIDIFDSPNIIYDFRIKRKNSIFYKECKKLGIKIISFLCLKDNSKYVDLPIYFNYKLIECVRIIIDLIKITFVKYEQKYKQKINE